MKITNWIGVRHRNAFGELKVIPTNVINEVRRLWFGGALLFALFLTKVSFSGKIRIFKKSQRFK